MCLPPPHLKVSRFYCKGGWPSDHTLFHAFCRASQEDSSEKVYAGPRSQSQLARAGIRTREHVGAAKAVQNGVRICVAHPWDLAPPRTRESLAHLTPLEPAFLT